MKAKIKLDKFIDSINWEEVKKQDKTKEDLSLFVEPKIYDSIKHLLIDGKYKGFKIYS